MENFENPPAPELQTEVEEIQEQVEEIQEQEVEQHQNQEHRQVEKKYVKRARVQITFAQKAAMERAKPSVGDASIYNIYYDKWYQQDKVKGLYQSAHPALTKCDPEKDCGVTRAEEISKDPFFCVFFARGCCSKGYECNYLHRIPTDEDEYRFERTRDCFGRERHRMDKEDLSGVGSFERDNKTIFVARIGAYSRRLYNVVKKHFSTFGEIVGIKLLYSKGIAFVKYKNRLNAEFAKEAMQDQPLEQNEILYIKWSSEDSKKETKIAEKEEAEIEFVERFFKDPRKVHTMAFLHDTQTDGDLNKYYQQQDIGNYQEHLIENRLAAVAGPDAKPSGNNDKFFYNQAPSFPVTAGVVMHSSALDNTKIALNPLKRAHEENEENKNSKKNSSLAALASYDSD